ncbi:hypothetical protein [Acinetobacter vivianii]|uniref:hypothetical protein n=1 Tax=Acinetobacter vivianii TaxID=1776742 RepID=UPI002DC004ED|nr:hypothetical protein [Acinetobacter vivianii]MEB6480593.1 hypothetical protein [Acinetobacter vivianii]MEB6656374.1 hypothetical protein [Acinetobacter vivianii]
MTLLSMRHGDVSTRYCEGTLCISDDDTLKHQLNPKVASTATFFIALILPLL